MKQVYDYAAEMNKIAESQEHKSLFTPMEKLAFSRDGKVEPSEIENEFAKLADDKKCEECGMTNCKCDHSKADDLAADDGKADENEVSDSASEEPKETVAFSTYAVDALLKIADGLEADGFTRLSAASLILADNLVKEAKAKKEKSKSKSKSDSKSKKMTEKEKAEKSKKDKEKSKSKASKK